jgi:hypothetical protein
MIGIDRAGVAGMLANPEPAVGGQRVARAEGSGVLGM